MATKKTVQVPDTVADVKGSEEAVVLSREELDALMAFRQARVAGESVENSVPANNENISLDALVEAFTRAFNATKTPEKKTVSTRKKGSPWDNPDGSPKPQMKRAFFQHGVEIQPNIVSAAEINLLNQIKPGLYCGGFVRVMKRKDRGYDIDYPIRTSAQRLRLSNQFGIVSLQQLLQRIVDEMNNPARFKGPDEGDDD